MSGNQLEMVDLFASLASTDDVVEAVGRAITAAYETGRQAERGDLALTAVVASLGANGDEVADAMNRVVRALSFIPDLVAALRRVREEHGQAGRMGECLADDHDRPVRWPCPTRRLAMLAGEEA